MYIHIYLSVYTYVYIGSKSEMLDSKDYY